MYKHILFSIEFGEGISMAVKKIKKLCDTFQSKISLIHVVEMPTIEVFPEIINKEPLYIKQAMNQLNDIGNELNASIDNQHVNVGNPKIIIPEFIKTHKVDLLIVGHHERQGIYHLLGSTACALISHAKCDVLTIPYPHY